MATLESGEFGDYDDVPRRRKVVGSHYSRLIRFELMTTMTTMMVTIVIMTITMKAMTIFVCILPS